MVAAAAVADAGLHAYEVLGASALG
jgi:hypothetical protein